MFLQKYEKKRFFSEYKIKLLYLYFKIKKNDYE